MRHPMRGILSALALLAITTASATGDITGKWYEKTGSAPLITIYQAGPEYTASLTDNGGTTAAGYRYTNTLETFNVTGGTHVEFRTSTLVFTASNGTLSQTRDYSLDLSPEGMRLIGNMNDTSAFTNGETVSSAMTLYKR